MIRSRSCIGGTARGALLALAVVAAREVHAEDGSTRTWSLHTGDSVIVEIGPHRSFLSLDPDRVLVETLGPGELRVTALDEDGAAVVHVFTAGGTRTLVFWVRPQSAPRLPVGMAPPGGGPDRARSQADFVYTALGVLSGDSSGSHRSTGHQLSLAQDYGDTRLDGYLSVSGEQGVGWSVPHLGAHARHDHLILSLGDESVDLVTSLASMPARGASLTWSPVPERTFVGAFVGVERPRSCCSLVEPDAATLAVVRGGYGLSERSWVRGSAGAVREPALDTTLPLLRLGFGHASSRSTLDVEVVRIGEGFGSTADLGLSRGRLDLAAATRLTRRGLYLGTTSSSHDTAHARIAPVLRLGDRWSVLSRGTIDRTHHPDAPVRVRALGEVGARFLPTEGHAVQATYRRLAGWEQAAEDWETDLAQHVGEVITAHAARRGRRFHNMVRVGLGADGGLDSLFAVHRSEFRVAGPWSAGAFATASVEDATGVVYLSAEAVRDARHLYLRSVLGASVGVGEASAAIGPTAGGQIGWFPVPEHALALDAVGSLATADRVGSWRMLLSYTWARSLGRRPGSRALGISGTVRGEVFEDRDADGMRGPGEGGIPGVLVRLDGGREVQTDAVGGFRFGAVAPGAHELSIDRADWHSVDGTHHPVEVSPLRTTQAQFALNSGGRILVRVFADRDRDGRYTPADRGVRVGDVDVLGVDAERVRGEAISTGFYEFRGLAPGRHTVALDPLDIPAGYAVLAPVRQEVEVERGGHRVVDFPLRALRAIGGRVLLDRNGDGIDSAGDEPASRVAVRLSDGQQRLTDDLGRFLFRDLDEGAYQVSTPGAGHTPVVSMENGPRDELDVVLLITDQGVFEQLLARPEGEPVPDAPPPDALHVEPAAAFLAPGQQVDLSVEAQWPPGIEPRELEAIAWSSSDREVAEVSASGRVTGRGLGVAEVVAEVRGVRSPPAVVEVADVPLVGLELSPAELRLGVGEEASATARAVLVTGGVAVVSEGVRWDSDDESVARVDAGRVVGVGYGEARLSAELQGVAAYPMRVVVGPPPQALGVYPEPGALLVGSEVALQARATYPDGTSVDITRFARWRSSSPAVIEVEDDGAALVHAPGVAILVGTWRGIDTPELRIEVHSGTVEHLAASPPRASLRVDDTLSLRLHAELDDGTEVDLSQLAGWSVSDEAVALVERNGTLTALTPGRTAVIARWTAPDGTEHAIEVPVRVKAQRKRGARE